MDEDEQQLQAIFALAKKFEQDGRVDDTEKLYAQSLKLADRIHGPLSPRTGIVINEFVHFCEENGNQEQAKELQARLQSIVKAEFPELIDGDS
jgi:uncharacterized HAD superfamily protein